MNQWGTGSKTMAKILENLSAETPITTHDLAVRVKMTESNLRCSLMDMVELGLAAKIRLPSPKQSIGKKPRTTAWLKYPPRNI